MKRILHNSFFKCIGPENKSGITFVEVVVVGILVPMVVKNIKSYVLNIDKNAEDQEEFMA